MRKCIKKHEDHQMKERNKEAKIKKIFARGARMAQRITFLLLAQRPRVRFPSFHNFFN